MLLRRVWTHHRLVGKEISSLTESMPNIWRQKHLTSHKMWVSTLANEHEQAVLRTCIWFEQWEFSLHHWGRKTTGGSRSLLPCTVSFSKSLGVEHGFMWLLLGIKKYTPAQISCIWTIQNTSSVVQRWSSDCLEEASMFFLGLSVPIFLLSFKVQQCVLLI